MCRPPSATTSSCSASVCRLEVLEDALVARPSARGRTRRGGRSRRTARPRRTAPRPSAAARRSARRAHCWRAMNSALPPSRMSVPRPAMFVAIVTAPLRPACATISASCAWYFAFSTTCLFDAAAGRRPALQPRRSSIVDSRSDFSIDTVPTSTGRPLLVLLEDLADDRVPLLLLGPVDEVRVLDAPQRPVRRDDDDVEVVDLRELLGLGVRRAGHAGQLLVLAEVVLEGDGRERLVLALDLVTFFPSPPPPGAARRSSGGPASGGR